jgi:hypothetical protein
MKAKEVKQIVEFLSEDPEVLASVIKELIAKYKPTVYSLAQEVVEVYKDYSNNTEYPATVAKVKKNIYDAYVNVGFTEDQAMALMINDNIQLMKYAQKVTDSASNANK